MVKKEFTRQLQKRLNDLSDVELIEELDGQTLGTGETYQNIVKAFLDRSLKITIQDLTEVIQKNNTKTKIHNKILIWLTIVITGLALLNLIALIL